MGNRERWEGEIETWAIEVGGKDRDMSNRERWEGEIETWAIEVGGRRER